MAGPGLRSSGDKLKNTRPQMLNRTSIGTKPQSSSNADVPKTTFAEERSGSYVVASCRIGHREMYPPPISCLKLVEDGKHLIDYEIDKHTGRVFVEEVRIPDIVLRAERGHERLRLYFAHPKEETDDEEEVKSKEED